MLSVAAAEDIESLLLAIGAVGELPLRMLEENSTEAKLEVGAAEGLLLLLLLEPPEPLATASVDNPGAVRLGDVLAIIESRLVLMLLSLLPVKLEPPGLFATAAMGNVVAVELSDVIVVVIAVNTNDELMPVLLKLLELRRIDKLVVTAVDDPMVPSDADMLEEGVAYETPLKTDALSPLPVALRLSTLPTLAELDNAVSLEEEDVPNASVTDVVLLSVAVDS